MLLVECLTEPERPMTPTPGKAVRVSVPFPSLLLAIIITPPSPRVRNPEFFLHTIAAVSHETCVGGITLIASRLDGVSRSSIHAAVVAAGVLDGGEVVAGAVDAGVGGHCGCWE